jgi:hypothetical protein
MEIEKYFYECKKSLRFCQQFSEDKTCLFLNVELTYIELLLLTSFDLKNVYTWQNLYLKVHIFIFRFFKNMYKYNLKKCLLPDAILSRNNTRLEVIYAICYKRQNKEEEEEEENNLKYIRG